MKILLAADGSAYTKKALAWLVANHDFAAGDELRVLTVQPRLPAAVAASVGASAVREYHEGEPAKVLKPIDKFLAKHDIAWHTSWVAGAPAEEILRAAKREKVHQIVMGTHGRGLLGQAVMGSVAQRVVSQSPVPVLLVP
jgi:nucleotide-binding universal stress UspA family protein